MIELDNIYPCLDLIIKLGGYFKNTQANYTKGGESHKNQLNLQILKTLNGIKKNKGFNQ